MIEEAKKIENKGLKHEEMSQIKHSEENSLNKSLAKSPKASNTKLKQVNKSNKNMKILEFETIKLPKIYTPYTYIMYSNKLAEAKERFKDSMKEIGLELEPSDGAKWLENLKQGEELLKKSISVKYLGVKNGQIGILSKRMPLSQEKSREIQQGLNVNDIKQQEYIVNKYSLPHQLHGINSKSERKKGEKFGENLGLMKKNDFSNGYIGKEQEIKSKIKRIIEKKKQSLREKTQNKLKNSGKAWDLFINEEGKMKELPFSYSSKLKTLSVSTSQNELKGKISKMLQAAFYH